MNNSLFLDLLKIENLKKLDCMSAFQENWNGVGGQAFSSASISIFRDIIENVCKQPNIAPTGRDSLLLQYELDDRSVLAFEVRENRIEMVCVPRGDYSSATSKVFTDDFIQQINSQVARFYYKQEKGACPMYKIKYDYEVFAEDNMVKTRIDPDDPLMERFNDPRKPIEQYEAGEEYIYCDFSDFDTDFIAEEDEDIHRPLYSRRAYEYCVIIMGRPFSHLHFSRRNFETGDLWKKMLAQENERKAALEAGVDFYHLPGIPCMGTIEE